MKILIVAVLWQGWSIVSSVNVTYLMGVSASGACCGLAGEVSSVGGDCGGQEDTVPDSSRWWPWGGGPVWPLVCFFRGVGRLPSDR